MKSLVVVFPNYFETEASIKLKSGDVTCSIIIPCFNEEANIRGAVMAALEGARLAKCLVEVIVIDDASNDNTLSVLRDLLREFSNHPIRLLVNKVNLGYAGSFKLGASLCKGKYCKIHCGDNVFPAETVKALLLNIGKVDAIIPFDRVMLGRSFFRKFLSKTYTHIVNLLSGNDIKYYNGCPILPVSLVLKFISPSSGFGFQADMLCKIIDSGVSYVHQEVTFIERKNGVSTAVNFKNFASVIKVLSAIAVRRLKKNYTKSNVLVDT